MSGSKRTNPLATFLAAVQFLLISPAFIRRPFTPQELGRAVSFYPLVGLLLGGLLAGIDGLLVWMAPPLLRSALLLAAWVLLTGALHLDGFLDSVDGLLGGYTPEKRLEIMRDERVGAYALAGGILLLLAQFSALASLETLRLPALLLAPVLGRWGMAAAIVAFPYARAQGLGRQIKDYAGPLQLAAATFLALAGVVVAYAISGEPAILVAPAAALIVLALGVRFILERIPGMTGDSYGALNQAIELSVLIALACAEYLMGGGLR